MSPQPTYDSAALGPVNEGTGDERVAAGTWRGTGSGRRAGRDRFRGPDRRGPARRDPGRRSDRRRHPRTAADPERAAARHLLRHGRLPGMPGGDRRARQSARLHDQAGPPSFRCAASAIWPRPWRMPASGVRALARRMSSTPDILVLGGGAGGLNAAAAAARAGAKVLLVDERPEPGGQFYKQPLAIPALAEEIAGDGQFAGGRALIAEAVAAGVEMRRGRADLGRLRAAGSHALRRAGELASAGPSASSSPPVPMSARCPCRAGPCPGS